LYRKTQFFEKSLLVGILFAFLFLNPIVGISIATISEILPLENLEIREYEGQNLSSISDFRENSIEGPQYIDVEDYVLTVTGLVNNEMAYTYDEMIGMHQSFTKVVTLHCVEGWSATILWEGILVEDLLEDVEVDPKATVVIFYAYDGYSTSLPLDYIVNNNIMVAYKMNNVTLPPERGFPFQLVAESKWGYKWIKWITEIELSDNKGYQGYWESRGYPNDADLSDEGKIPEFQLWIILPIVLVATIAVIIYRTIFTRKWRQSRFTKKM
jgi:DMSO/TMAO reductase YedYZ molybdopterin-dependent catalytic subunit